jgi:hypothetical protein
MGLSGLGLWPSTSDPLAAEIGSGRVSGPAGARLNQPANNRRFGPSPNGNRGTLGHVRSGSPVSRRSGRRLPGPAPCDREPRARLGRPAAEVRRRPGTPAPQQSSHGAPGTGSDSWDNDSRTWACGASSVWDRSGKGLRKRPQGAAPQHIAAESITASAAAGGCSLRTGPRSHPYGRAFRHPWWAPAAAASRPPRPSRSR